MWIAIRRFLGRKERQGPHGRRSAVVQNKTFVFESVDKSAWLHLITSVERGLWRDFNARNQELTVILHDPDNPDDLSRPLSDLCLGKGCFLSTRQYYQMPKLPGLSE
jgi:hypothetical protein